MLDSEKESSTQVFPNQYRLADFTFGGFIASRQECVHVLGLLSANCIHFNSYNKYKLLSVVKFKRY